MEKGKSCVCFVDAEPDDAAMVRILLKLEFEVVLVVGKGDPNIKIAVMRNMFGNFSNLKDVVAGHKTQDDYINMDYMRHITEIPKCLPWNMNKTIDYIRDADYVISTKPHTELFEIATTKQQFFEKPTFILTGSMNTRVLAKEVFVDVSVAMKTIIRQFVKPTILIESFLAIGENNINLEPLENNYELNALCRAWNRHIMEDATLNIMKLSKWLIEEYEKTVEFGDNMVTLQEKAMDAYMANPQKSNALTRFHQIAANMMNFPSQMSKDDVCSVIPLIKPELLTRVSFDEEETDNGYPMFIEDVDNGTLFILQGKEDECNKIVDDLLNL